MDRVRVSLGGGSSSSFLSQSQRLILGILVLILVDIIWVASSELTRYIFHDEKFDKPFFSTYLKTSMFLIFLFGFLGPWRHELCKKRSNSHMYTLLAANNNDENENSDQNNARVEHTTTEPVDPEIEEEIDGNDNEIINETTQQEQPSLSSPSFIPIKYERNSGNESDDSGISGRINLVNGRKVGFSKLAEVRQLSQTEATDAIISRMNFHASVQAEQLAFRLSHRLNIPQTAHLALSFCLLWFMANWTYQMAISKTQVGIVNVLSSSSSLFTLVLASIFPSVASDSITLTKFVSVLISLSGVVIVSLSDIKEEKRSVPLGAIGALTSACFYAAYLVFLRKKVDHEDKLDIPLFFGFVGLSNLLILWPLFFLLDYLNIEEFEWPNKRQWIFIIVNGLIGTVFSEVLWLWGCFLSSSLIATLAISLTIPLSMIADILLKRVSYSLSFYLGSIPMLFSFFAVTLLTHWDNWDPLYEICKKIYTKLCKIRRSSSNTRMIIGEIEEENEDRETLIGENESEEGNSTEEN